MRRLVWRSDRAANAPSGPCGRITPPSLDTAQAAGLHHKSPDFVLLLDYAADAPTGPAAGFHRQRAELALRPHYTAHAADCVGSGITPPMRRTRSAVRLRRQRAHWAGGWIAPPTRPAVLAVKSHRPHWTLPWRPDHVLVPKRPDGRITLPTKPASFCSQITPPRSRLHSSGLVCILETIPLLYYPVSFRIRSLFHIHKKTLE
jgi:hypothetical protein